MYICLYIILDRTTYLDSWVGILASGREEAQSRGWWDRSKKVFSPSSCSYCCHSSYRYYCYCYCCSQIEVSRVFVAFLPQLLLWLVGAGLPGVFGWQFSVLHPILSRQRGDIEGGDIRINIYPRNTVANELVSNELRRLPCTRSMSTLPD